MADWKSSNRSQSDSPTDLSKLSLISATSHAFLQPLTDLCNLSRISPTLLASLRRLTHLCKLSLISATSDSSLQPLTHRGYSGDCRFVIIPKFSLNVSECSKSDPQCFFVCCSSLSLPRYGHVCLGQFELWRTVPFKLPNSPGPVSWNFRRTIWSHMGSVPPSRLARLSRSPTRSIEGWEGGGTNYPPGC
jgi:hypothetical protein